MSVMNTFFFRKHRRTNRNGPGKAKSRLFTHAFSLFFFLSIAGFPVISSVRSSHCHFFFNFRLSSFMACRDGVLCSQCPFWIARGVQLAAVFVSAASACSCQRCIADYTSPYFTMYNYIYLVPKGRHQPSLITVNRKILGVAWFFYALYVSINSSRCGVLVSVENS